MAGRKGKEQLERDSDINRLDRSHHVAGAIGFQISTVDLSRYKCFRYSICMDPQTLASRGIVPTMLPPACLVPYIHQEIHSYSFRKHTIGAAGSNHLPVTEVLPQGNANAPGASIRRMLAPAMPDHMRIWRGRSAVMMWCLVAVEGTLPEYGRGYVPHYDA
ncbi:hypothetical protein PIB30_073990 [Stylosanthes scabra]|uniref:Uncharacterized protein n=1 Tax=Stylosanthes scabra TaxID=79078 RepID=A0ABU6UN97_9FABA|nr:hypothetical protein [Stylosanthes scabra]